MEIMTVSQVSKTFQVSTRMLRYYEKTGLIESVRKEDYSYRFYDETAVNRLQQILILRKLRIPLKQIAVILDDQGQRKALQTLQENIALIDEEMSALGTIRNILNEFVVRLDKSIQDKIRFNLLEDSVLIGIANGLIPPRSNLKEDYSVNELNSANEKIDSKMEVRIVYLPPSAVAASQYTGENPEDVSGERMAEFIRKTDLTSINPGFRVYGFNNPSPQEGQEHYGYEFWATIPESLDVSGPLEKKQFAGGLYAAHCIKMGDFHEWKTFYDLVNGSSEYDVDWRESYGMGGSLEEHLNAFSYYTGSASEFMQLDLLIPIKKKEKHIAMIVEGDMNRKR